jgi:hypothetical protein
MCEELLYHRSLYKSHVSELKRTVGKQRIRCNICEITIKDVSIEEHIIESSHLSIKSKLEHDLQMMTLNLQSEKSNSVISMWKV